MMIEISYNEKIILLAAISRHIDYWESILPMVDVGPQIEPADQFANMSVAENIIEAKELEAKLKAL